MIYHTPGDMSVIVHADGFSVVPSGQPLITDVVGNADLLRVAHTAPHECSDPQCPGNLNRRKLEAFDGLLAFIEMIAGSEHAGSCFKELGQECTCDVDAAQALVTKATTSPGSPGTGETQ